MAFRCTLDSICIVYTCHVSTIHIIIQNRIVCRCQSKSNTNGDSKGMCGGDFPQSLNQIVKVVHGLNLNVP